MPGRETDTWMWRPAKWFTKTTKGRVVRLVVMHTMEAPEKFNTAENVAKYFQTTTRPASAHVCVDNDSIVQCVRDRDIAFAAPGANHDGVHVELAGYAKQLKGDWDDEYSRAMITKAADVVAQYCLKYNLPCVQLTDTQLKAGVKGIVGHDQVSRVYKRSTHTDPGPNFPWASLIEQANNRIWELK